MHAIHSEEPAFTPRRADPTAEKMADNCEELYRLAPASEVPDDAWKTRLQWTTAYMGTSGMDDKFISLSTAAHLAHTAESTFSGKADVMLLRFSTESMKEEADLEVRWTPAPDSDEKIPHVYGGPIPYACLAVPPAMLELGADGKHVFPPLGPLVASAGGGAVGNNAAQDEDDMYHSSDGSYDGCAATGMYG